MSPKAKVIIRFFVPSGMLIVLSAAMAGLGRSDDAMKALLGGIAGTILGIATWKIFISEDKPPAAKDDLTAPIEKTNAGTDRDLL